MAFCHKHRWHRNDREKEENEFLWQQAPGWIECRYRGTPLNCKNNISPYRIWDGIFQSASAVFVFKGTPTHCKRWRLHLYRKTTEIKPVAATTVAAATTIIVITITITILNKVTRRLKSSTTTRYYYSNTCVQNIRNTPGITMPVITDHRKSKICSNLHKCGLFFNFFLCWSF